MTKTAYRHLPALRKLAQTAVMPTQRSIRPFTGDVREQFARAQVINAHRDAAALRPFRPNEFGQNPASPSPAHIQAANQLIARFRRRLLRSAAGIDQQAESGLEAGQWDSLLRQKETTVNRTKLVERIWDYYLELFGQRQSRFANMLLGLDRMAHDCYQAIYTGLGKGRSIPSPPPFSYMETGFTPSTFRRGIKLSKIGRKANPFPIVQLPYHRMVNPWTLGAVHHEVAHNIQNDLGLWQEVPQRITKRLRKRGLPPNIARRWGRLHKEIWADLCAGLLGGPGIIASLLDVLARSPRSTLRYNAQGVHPTPYFRLFINTELLRRMGFTNEAQQFNQLWNRLYPNPGAGNIPETMLRSFPACHRLVVDTICYQPYRQLGNKSLAQVSSFNRNHKQMTKEAAHRLAQGIDPGIIPARFLVGAVRHGLDSQLAAPDQLARNFYQALSKR